MVRWQFGAGAVGLLLLGILGMPAVPAAEPSDPRPPSPSAPSPLVADRILILKEQRLMRLEKAGQTIRDYRIALGRQPVGHKQREGDGRTPEGMYHIAHHKPDSAFHRALAISYPSAQDRAQARLRGDNPGGQIMIHGLRDGRMGQLHRAVDWTEGCIAVTNEEIEEIYALVPDGTPVEIRP